MIRNIGFGEDATHTKFEIFEDVIAHEIDFPLKTNPPFRLTYLIKNVFLMLSPVVIYKFLELRVLRVVGFRRQPMHETNIMSKGLPDLMA